MKCLKILEPNHAVVLDAPAPVIGSRELLVRVMASGRVITEPLITDHFAFSEYPRAYTHIEEKKDESVKVMFDLD